jgi:hypothetical protein
MEINFRKSVEDGLVTSAETPTPEGVLASLDAPLPCSVGTPEFREAEQAAMYYLTACFKRANELLTNYAEGIGADLFVYPNRKIELLRAWHNLKRTMRFYFAGDEAQV